MVNRICSRIITNDIANHHHRRRHHNRENQYPMLINNHHQIQEMRPIINGKIW